MSFDYKFGMPEVIAMIVGTLFLVIVGFALRSANIPYAVETEAIVIVVIATLFGATAGGIVAVATSILYLILFHFNADVVHIAAFVLLAAGMGHYAGDFGVREGTFGIRSAVEFCVIHLLLEGVMWMFFIPFLTFLLKRDDLYQMLDTGMTSLLFTILADLALIPLFALISYAVVRWKKYKRNAPGRGLMNQ
ncbi:MAG: hypothetical protein IJU25_03865 [Lachnospiraceae bacterium]|nr:hypothetical protein [Lachnospiraceae bacterium]